MIVHVPTALRSYTGRRAEVDADGATLAALLLDLDRRHPGLRFRIVDEQDRIRVHIRLFVNRDQADDLGASLAPTDEVHIVCALSGG
jgi:sulfur-carrier protein